MGKTSKAKVALPTPADRPNADVVLYDGACGICTRQVARLPWWDSQGSLAYLSIHDPEIARRWPDLSRERLLEEMCIVDVHGERHWGPYALRYLTRRLRRLWWAAPLFHFPGFMWVGEPLYRFIARNRYRLSRTGCDGDACDVHR